MVEILSDDDKMDYVLQKCMRYAEWGCAGIYVVQISTRTVFEWSENSLLSRKDLAGISVQKIWSAFDRELARMENL